MYTLIGLTWIVCGVFVSIKWFNKAEKKMIRYGSAMRRLIFSIWDWVLYFIVSMVLLLIPFAVVLSILFQWGWLIQIIAVIVLIIVIIPNDRTKKIRNAYRADGSYVVRLNLYSRRHYEAIYNRSYFRDCHIQYHLCKCSFLGGNT